MAVDISKLNQKQLNDLISEAENRKKEIRQERIVALRNKINELVKSEGYALEDVLGSRRKPRHSTGRVSPKFFNPANRSETWSGRGKRPRWFNDAIQRGKTKEDMLIK